MDVAEAKEPPAFLTSPLQRTKSERIRGPRGRSRCRLIPHSSRSQAAAQQPSGKLMIFGKQAARPGPVVQCLALFANQLPARVTQEAVAPRRWLSFTVKCLEFCSGSS